MSQINFIGSFSSHNSRGKSAGFSLPIHSGAKQGSEEDGMKAQISRNLSTLGHVIKGTFGYLIVLGILKGGQSRYPFTQRLGILGRHSGYLSFLTGKPRPGNCERPVI